MKHLHNAPLGKASDNPEQYDPSLLFPIAREVNRQDLGIQDRLPFLGVDIWNAYELSWLNLKGKPQIGIAEFIVPADSPFMIESKSWKLYLNSLNFHTFASSDEVKKTLEKDLSEVAGARVGVKLLDPQETKSFRFQDFSGTLLDRLDIEVDTQTKPDDVSLSADEKSSPCEEVLVSHLLKSNCPVTGQPDWASIAISYVGQAINQEQLLRYLIAFRHVQEFHEHCVEKIFLDIHRQCRPHKLSVYARYTRRGGLDINPFRTNFNTAWPDNLRHARQ